MPATTNIAHLIESTFRAAGENYQVRISAYVVPSLQEIDIFVIDLSDGGNANHPTKTSYRCRLSVDEFAEMFVEYAKVVLDE